LRRRIARQVDDSFLNELDDVNANIVSAKNVAITKAKLQAIAKLVDPVVEKVHEKRRGRPTLA
jgi:hypothetical protein